MDQTGNVFVIHSSDDKVTKFLSPLFTPSIIATQTQTQIMQNHGGMVTFECHGNIFTFRRKPGSAVPINGKYYKLSNGLCVHVLSSRNSNTSNSGLIWDVLAGPFDNSLCK